MFWGDHHENEVVALRAVLSIALFPEIAQAQEDAWELRFAGDARFHDSFRSGLITEDTGAG